MAARVLLPTPPCHYYKTTAATTTSGLSHCTVPALPHRFRQVSGRGGGTLAKRGAAAAAVPPEQSSLSLPGTAAAYETVADVKAALYRALESTDRGIFGMTSAKRSEIHGLVELLESRNPTPEPTTKLKEKVDGCWKLIYSTISILGKKRTTLGLREFISLGDFLQIIDVKEVELRHQVWGWDRVMSRPGKLGLSPIDAGVLRRARQVRNVIASKLHPGLGLGSLATFRRQAGVLRDLLRLVRS